jgi:hypothetical protein
MDLNGDGRVDAEDVQLALDKAEAIWAVVQEKAPQYTPQVLEFSRVFSTNRGREDQ